MGGAASGDTNRRTGPGRSCTSRRSARAWRTRRGSSTPPPSSTATTTSGSGRRTPPTSATTPGCGPRRRSARRSRPAALPRPGHGAAPAPRAGPRRSGHHLPGDLRPGRHGQDRARHRLRHGVPTPSPGPVGRRLDADQRGPRRLVAPPHPGSRAHRAGRPLGGRRPRRPRRPRRLPPRVRQRSDRLGAARPATDHGTGHGAGHQPIAPLAGARHPDRAGPTRSGRGPCPPPPGSGRARPGTSTPCSTRSAASPSPSLRRPPTASDRARGSMT